MSAVIYPEWNTDMSQAPKGSVATVPMLSKDGTPKLDKQGEPIFRKIIKVDLVWVDPGDGSPAGTSKWLPVQERWSGFKHGQEPVAFIALPPAGEVT